MEDSHHSICSCTTNVYKIDVAMDGKIESLTFGSLPVLLRVMLDVGQSKGVIGTELLKKYSIILSNLNKYLVPESYNEEESPNPGNDNA